MEFFNDEKELILNEMLNHSDSLSKFLSKINIKELNGLDFSFYGRKLYMDGLGLDILKKINLNDRFYLAVVLRETYDVMQDKVISLKDIFIVLDNSISLNFNRGFCDYLQKQLLDAVKCSISQREKDFIINNISSLEVYIDNEEEFKKNKKRL